MAFDRGAAVSLPGTGSSKGGGDWLWHPRAREGSRLELHHLAGRAEPEGGRGGCRVACGRAAPRIAAAPHRLGGMKVTLFGVGGGIQAMSL